MPRRRGSAPRTRACGRARRAGPPAAAPGARGGSRTSRSRTSRAPTWRASCLRAAPQAALRQAGARLVRPVVLAGRHARALTIPKGNVRHVQILSGGKLRDLARGRAPAWSPDGRWIAFLSGQTVGSAIFLVHPDGTGLHAIGNRHLELGSSPPAWSPDGRTLVYTRQTRGSSALWAIGADGSRTVRS